MPQKKNLVTLTPDERGHPADLIRTGKASALVLTRARILLAADQADGGPALEGAVAAEELGAGVRTIGRVRQRFVERGFEDCVPRKRQDRPGRERNLDGTVEARLIALACSDPPDGRDVWIIQLLAGKLVELKVVDAVADEAVRRTLQKTRSAGTSTHPPVRTEWARRAVARSIPSQQLPCRRAPSPNRAGRGAGRSRAVLVS